MFVFLLTLMLMSQSLFGADLDSDFDPADMRTYCQRLMNAIDTLDDRTQLQQEVTKLRVDNANLKNKIQHLEETHAFLRGNMWYLERIAGFFAYFSIMLLLIDWLNSFYKKDSNCH